MKEKRSEEQNRCQSAVSDIYNIAILWEFAWKVAERQSSGDQSKDKEPAVTDKYLNSKKSSKPDVVLHFNSPSLKSVHINKAKHSLRAPDDLTTKWSYDIQHRTLIFIMRFREE